MPLDAESLERRRRELENELAEPITLDRLTAGFSIFQRRRGHRHSTDDLLTGWYALEKIAGRPIDRHLDLGTGIGTVGLLVLSGLPGARLTCIEAQDISHRFLRENLRANGVEDRVTAIHGDLRDATHIDERFPLVTGSPPYFDVGAGIVPADSQKAHARFELRGTVADYARTARRTLEPDGLFVFCFPFAQKERALRAARSEGFAVVTQRDVIPREGLSPLFSLFACRVGEHREVEEDPFVVRHADGSHTDAMHSVRARFGFTPQRKPTPS